MCTMVYYIVMKVHKLKLQIDECHSNAKKQTSHRIYTGWFHLPNVYKKEKNEKKKSNV